MTRAEALVIANMAAGETRASNIARNLGVSRQAISQILSELSDRGIVVVTDDPRDRRSRIAKLAQGMEDEDELCVRIFTALEKELEGRIGPRLMKGLYEALEGAWGEAPLLAKLPILREVPKAVDFEQASAVGNSEAAGRRRRSA